MFSVYHHEAVCLLKTPAKLPPAYALYAPLPSTNSFIHDVGVTQACTARIHCPLSGWVITSTQCHPETASALLWPACHAPTSPDTTECVSAAARPAFQCTRFSVYTERAESTAQHSNAATNDYQWDLSDLKAQTKPAIISLLLIIRSREC